MYWRPKPSILHDESPSTGRSEADPRGMSPRWGWMGLERWDRKSLRLKAVEDFAEDFVFVSFLAHLNSGQIFNFVSVCKYKIEQKQARDRWSQEKEHMNKEDRKTKSSSTIAKKKQVSKDQEMDYLLFAMHRVKEFILHFPLFWSHECSEGEIMSLCFRWNRSSN